MSERRVLITGASGFIGARLAALLLDEGAQVHVLRRPGSKNQQLQSIAARIGSHVYDGSQESMAAAVDAARPTVVVHLASLFLLNHTLADVAPLISSNILMGTHLLDAMAARQVWRFINTGTPWQHYQGEDYNPVCLYAATKQAFEAMMGYYTKTTPMTALTLKMGETYGPGDPRGKIFALLARISGQAEPLAMSPGEQMMDCVYIDDAVSAFRLAIQAVEKQEPGRQETYYVGPNKPVKLKELVGLYEQALGRKLPITWGGRPYRGREVMTPWTKGARVPGWEPKIDLAEGVRRTLGKNT